MFSSIILTFCLLWTSKTQKYKTCITITLYCIAYKIILGFVGLFLYTKTLSLTFELYVSVYYIIYIIIIILFDNRHHTAITYVIDIDNFIFPH
jgi:hypothetical protein